MAHRQKRVEDSAVALAKGTILRRMIGLTILVVALLSGCGATVGDPCTTASDCSNQLCINQPWTLGGYCSKACTAGDDTTCPSGSTCIANGNGHNSPACFRVCNTVRDCRGGYSCLQPSNNSKMICVGPEGIPAIRD